MSKMMGQDETKAVEEKLEKVSMRSAILPSIEEHFCLH